ncbi:hypothetical protein pb186bvf_013378 [Paramecium bursaria]
MLMEYKTYTYIAVYLQQKDLLNFSATCKTYNHYVSVFIRLLFKKQYQYAFFVHYQSEFLSAQIQTQIDFNHPDSEYRQKIIQLIFQNTNTNWQQQSKEIITLRKQIEFPLYIVQEIIPKPTLKRETIGAYCESDLQQMLAQRLEQEQKGFDKLFEFQTINDELMKHFKSNKEQLTCLTEQYLKENQHAKEAFLTMRWWFQETEYIQTNNLVLEILQQIYKLLEIYLVALRSYFSEFKNYDRKNAYDILFEYQSYWQSYTNSLLEMQQIFLPFEDIINEIHQVSFPLYSQYPRFSIWRTAVKMWIKILVHQNFEFIELQEECFFRIIKQLRSKNIYKSFDSDEQIMDMDNQMQITHELYENFIKKKQMSTYYLEEIETNHPKVQDFNELLSNQFKAFSDLSLQEISIHWVGHTQCPYEKLYEQFLERFLHESSLYYDQYKGVFEKDIDQFINFLYQDQNFTIAFLPDTLYQKLIELQKEHLFTQFGLYIRYHFLQDFIQDNPDIIIQVYNQNPKDRISITSSQVDEQLDTQGDEASKIFNYFVEHPNADLDELLLNDKLQNDAEPLQELIKFALSELQTDIDMVLGQDIPPPFIIKKLSRAFSSCKNLQQQQQHHEVPEEFIKIIKSKMQQNQQLSLFIDKFNDFRMNFEKQSFKFLKRNREIDILNEDREIPKQIDNCTAQFYNICSYVDYQLLELNKLPVQEEIQEEDDVEKEELKLSKHNSKQLKLQVQESIEEYNSDDQND